MDADLLGRYTKTIDALCIEAAHSSNEHDIGVMLAILGMSVWSAERDLGYDHELAGEVSGDCWEDSRCEYWYPKLKRIVESAGTFDEKIALALALHRGEWYLRRVERYGAEQLTAENSHWVLNF